MKNRLKTDVIGHNYIWKEVVDSTNEEAKRLAMAGAVHGTVVVARQQTKGKGRRGRVWESPDGDNIYLSILLRPSIEPQYASMVTLVSALSAAKAIEEGVGVSCQIKWPNDLVLNKKKICGILTEMSMTSGGEFYLILGIGINVNMEEFPEEIGHMATSLKKETGKSVKTGNLIASFLYEFEKDYDTFIEYLSLEPLLEDYNGRLVNAGQQVQILSGGDPVIRMARGIDASGALIVSDERGRIEKIISGEVSVRGLYGYV